MKVYFRKELKNWILLFLFSLFATFLLNDWYGYNLRLTVSVVVIIFTIFAGLKCFADRSRGGFQFSRKLKKIFLIVSIILATLLTLGFSDFFSKKIVNNPHVTVTSLQQKNEFSKGTAATLKTVIHDRNFFGLEEFAKKVGGVYKNGELMIEKGQSFDIKIPKSSEIALRFNTSAQSGFVKIEDGYKEVILDLYTYKDSTQLYFLNSTHVLNNFSYLKLGASWLMMIVSIYIISQFFYFEAKYKKNYFPLIIAGILIVWGFTWNIIPGVNTTPDSFDYLKFDLSNISKFQLEGRTFVYPLFINLCLFLGGSDGYLSLISILQNVLMFSSLWFIYQSAKMISNKKIAYFIVILYALEPAITNYNSYILTESLTLSMLSLLIYLLFKYIKTLKLKYGIIAVITALMMTFLRPTSLAFSLILFAFTILRCFLMKDNRKQELKLFLVSLCTVLFIGAYALLFNQQFGYFSISDPMPRQLLFNVMATGQYKNSTDEDFKSTIEYVLSIKDLDEWSQMLLVKDCYKEPRILRFVEDCKKNNPQAYIQSIVDLSIRLAPNTVIAQNYKENYLFRSNESFSGAFAYIQGISFQSLRFIHVYAIVLIELLLSIIEWIKNKKIPWIHLGLFAFPLSVLLVTIIGTSSEYERTAICVIPFAYITLASYLKYLFKDSRSNESREAEY